MKGDRITIATQNTKGLSQGFIRSKKRKELKEIFKQTTPPTYILLLQETKILEVACLKQARFIEFRGGSSLWNEATFSAQTTRFMGGGGNMHYTVQKNGYNNDATWRSVPREGAVYHPSAQPSLHIGYP